MHDDLAVQEREVYEAGLVQITLLHVRDETTLSFF